MELFSYLRHIGHNADPDPEARLIVPDLTIFAHAIFFFLSCSLFFSLFVHFFASHLALGIPINRQRKERSKNEAEKYIIT